MKIKDCMKRNVSAVNAKTSIREAAKIIADKHIGSLPVIDGQGKLVGLLQLRDLLELVLPDFINLIDDFDFVDGGELWLNGALAASILANSDTVHVRWARPHLLPLPIPLLSLSPRQATGKVDRGHRLAHLLSGHGISCLQFAGPVLPFLPRPARSGGQA